VGTKLRTTVCARSALAGNEGGVVLRLYDHARIDELVTVANTYVSVLVGSAG